MPIQTESLNKTLYEMLKVRGYNPKSLNSSGKPVPVPDEADVFKFTFSKDGKDYDNVWVTLEGPRNIVLYYDDDVMDSGSENTSKNGNNDTWLAFVKNLKNWAMRRQLGFELKNGDHLAYDMAQREDMKKQENISEGYYPMGKSASYNDNVPTVKIILQHTRQIQEGEQRYRNVARIFLENTQGERILAPTNKPGIAQVYARHLAEGGVPNDERWNHLKSLCEEYSSMAGFVRAVRGNQFNESAQRLVEEGLNHYQSLRESLGKMRGSRGYNAYFESWTPTLMETEGDETNLNELFVQETLDPRIESVMPILSRIHKKVSESVIDKEMNKLAEWADSLVEEESIKSNNPVGIPEEENGAESFGGFAEDLDANQKRVGQLGPTEKVGKKGAVGKLVGANENFINMDAQAVTTEDEMDEGTHTQHDRDLNPNDYERPPTDWSTDPIEAGTDRIHQKIASVLKRLSKPASKPLDKSQTDIGSVLEAALPWEDDDEAEKREKEDKENKDTKGKDGAEHGGHSRAKHLAKQAIPKEEVKEGQDELNSMLRLLGEGAAGEIIGGTAGLIAGGALGSAAGPIGSVVGGAIGGQAGQVIGREVTKEEQLNEFAPLIAAGARLIIPALARVGPILGRWAATAGRAGAEVAGKAATGVGRGAADVAKSAAQSAAQNAGKIGVGAGAYQAITDVANSAVGGVGQIYNDVGGATSAIAQAVGNALDSGAITELAKAAVKYAIPVGILLALLYGGKKLLDKVMGGDAEPAPAGAMVKEGQDELARILTIMNHRR